MKKSRLFLLILAAVVMMPTIVYAAVGSFSSSSSTAAVTATNSAGGRAVSATAKTGYAGVFTRTSTVGAIPSLQGTSYSNYPNAAAVYGYNLATNGQTLGVYGRTNSVGDNSTGVYGFATGASGATNGVWGNAPSVDGTGVFGTANGGNGIGIGGLGTLFGVLGSGSIGVIGGGSIGVLGESSGIGDGTYGILSNTDAAVVGHLVGGGTNLAGSCTIAASTATSPTCSFADQFPDLNVSIVVTPTGDPGGYWYTTLVSSSGHATGFTITRSATPASAVTFNYVVVGLDSSIAAIGAKASKEAHTAQVSRR
jgi:hypothetical protein